MLLGVPVYLSAIDFPGLFCIYPRLDGMIKLIWLTDYIVRWFSYTGTANGLHT